MRVERLCLETDIVMPDRRPYGEWSNEELIELAGTLLLMATSPSGKQEAKLLTALFSSQSRRRDGKPAAPWYSRILSTSLKARE